MTNPNDPARQELEAELHRRYTQAFEQYANLARAFISQAMPAAATPPPSTPPLDLNKVLSDWFQNSITGSGGDLSQYWARLAAGPSMAPSAGVSPLDALLAKQESIGRRLFELAGQCQRLQNRLATYWAGVGQAAAQSFTESMPGSAAKSQAATDPTQWPQQIYSAWIDSAERSYTQAAQSAEYVQILAELSNSVHALKAEQGTLMELWAKFFDQPSRIELNALHAQLRELREQVRALREGRRP